MDRFPLDKAKSTRSAKMQAKRLFPQGGTIFGYMNKRLIYTCKILPQGAKLPGGRCCFSNRDHAYRDGHRGPWPRPDRFTFHTGV